MTSRLSLLAAVAVAALGFAGAASAQDFTPKEQGRWVVDMRATTVAPDEDAPIVTAANAPTGLHAGVSNDTMPTLGISYFVTDHVAVDVTLGTTKHTVSAVGPGGSTEVHDSWVLPPVVTVQYHFNPKGRFSPYVGTGPNYMLFYGGKDKNGFKVKLDDGFGWAAQGGFDYAIKDNWALNVDVKKVWFSTDATINGGALKSNVKLDPWVVSVGLGYRF